jgi:hypothetical protein
MKLLTGFLGVLLLAFSADIPESVETKIARAMSAGPRTSRSRRALSTPMRRERWSCCVRVAMDSPACPAIPR